MNSNWIVCTLFAGLLAACGGGGGGGASAPAVPAARAPATAAVPAITFAATKIFHFSWTDVSDATHYRLLENPDGNSGFSQVGSDIPTGIQKIALKNAAIVMPDEIRARDQPKSACIGSINDPIA